MVESVSATYTLTSLDLRYRVEAATYSYFLLADGFIRNATRQSIVS